MAEGVAGGPWERLDFDAADDSRRSLHRVFRYPAKFHAPVVDALLRRYTQPGDRVWDPFCGSGTLLVEAVANGRAAVGTDVDPLAAFISEAKITAYDLVAIESATSRLRAALVPLARSSERLAELAEEDLSDEQLADELGELVPPSIPRINHWFRRHVVADLATIRAAIASIGGDPNVDRFLLLAFASIIRNVSNADPVPVSGLEVTAHMRRIEEAGRVIDTYSAFDAAIRKALRAVQLFRKSLDAEAPAAHAYVADATEHPPECRVDAIITSPPYQNAVDYYRRHQLEMFWLGLTRDQDERLELLPRYVGRHRVPASHPSLNVDLWNPGVRAKEWEATIAATSESRARDFRAYLVSMTAAFRNLASALPVGAPAVMVVGRSTWNGESIPTDELFVEAAEHAFDLDEHLYYPVKNRYMSYSRHNGASIDEEHVIVLRRT